MPKPCVDLCHGLVMIDTFLSRLPRPGAQDGFMLIEVMISAMLVALIAVATFDGFSVTQRATGDERAHAQATVIAQQDEERLRGMTAPQLGQLGTGSTHTVAENGVCVEQVSATWRYFTGATTSFCEKSSAYSGTYTGTVFTVTSSARYVTAAKESFTCETSGGTADYIQTTSSVTWTALGSRPAVSQSSLVSLPSGSGLEVKVKNQNEEPVSGATVTATSATSQITPSSGCVIFGGLAEKTVSTDASKSNWVDHNGKSPPPAKSVTLSPTSLSTEEFTIAEPGAILPQFMTQASGKEVTAQGDTFVALQTGISAPDFFVGGVAGMYKSSSELPGLFPFVTPGKPTGTPNPYTVFAGDCEANNPAIVTASGEKVSDRTAQVEPGGMTIVKVEVPAVNVTVKSGSGTGSEGTPVTSTSAKIINSECKGVAAQNYASGVTYTRSVALSGGALEAQYQHQPFAKKLELCVAAKESSKYYENSFSLTNTAKAGTTSTQYLKASSTGLYKESSSELKC